MMLIDGDIKYLEEYKKAYKLMVEKYKEGLIRKHNIIFKNPDEINIIEMMMNNRDRSKLPPKYVPSYDYFFVDDGRLLGIIQIRIELTSGLLQYGGNIGYAVNPMYWKRGYGTKILELGLRKAKELGIEKEVLITCDDNNVGSYKIIEKNGGILENKVINKDGDEEFITRRYWIKL